MKLTEQQQNTLLKFNIAKENFLLEIGWTKDGETFSPPGRIFGWDSSDKLSLDVAVVAEENNCKNKLLHPW